MNAARSRFRRRLLKGAEGRRRNATRMVWILGFGLVPAFVAAAPPPPSLRPASTHSLEGAAPDDDLSALKAEVRALRVIRFLELDRRQLEALLPIVEKADALRRKLQEDRRRVLDEQLQAFADFKREDLADQGFSPKVEQRAGQAERQGKELGKRAAEDAAPLAAEAEAVLTPTQRFLAGIARLGPDQAIVLPAPARKVPPPVRDLLGTLERLRAAPAERREAAAEAAAREVVAQFASRGRAADDPEADRKRIASDLCVLCEVDSEKLRAYGGEALARLRPLTRRERLQREMDRLHAEEVGSFSPVARFLMSEGALPAVRLRLEALRGAAAGRADSKTADHRR